MKMLYGEPKETKNHYLIIERKNGMDQIPLENVKRVYIIDIGNIGEHKDDYPD